MGRVRLLDDRKVSPRGEKLLLGPVWRDAPLDDVENRRGADDRHELMRRRKLFVFVGDRQKELTDVFTDEL